MRIAGSPISLGCHYYVIKRKNSFKVQQLSENLCAIWGTSAEGHCSKPFVWQYNSSRADGLYAIHEFAWSRIRPDDFALKAKITTWLINERRSGNLQPLVTEDVLDKVKSLPRLKLNEIIDRLLMYFHHIKQRPGTSLFFNFHENDQVTRYQIAAWTESEDDDEAIGFLRLAIFSKLLLWERYELSLTMEGWERLESLENRNQTSQQGFVAMWFGSEMSKAFSEGFSPGISDAGFQPFRIDQKEHANKIDDEIIAEIRRSRFVVADFTCPLLSYPEGKITPNARGGVYYEAGFAQGLNIPVIWTVRADCLEHVHFDVRQFAHIVWNEPADLRVSLYNRIRALIV